MEKTKVRAKNSLKTKIDRIRGKKEARIIHEKKVIRK